MAEYQQLKGHRDLKVYQLAYKLADADGEAAETQVRLDFARDCEYMNPELHAELVKGYEEVGKMLGAMMSIPEKFMPSNLRHE